jgi:transposase
MNNHKNARLTPHGRALLVRRVLEEGLRPAEAAQAMGVSRRTAYKWLRRYREEGLSGLQNRTSKPRHCPHQTSAQFIGQVIERRRRRQTYRQTALREWAYARAYPNSNYRAKLLLDWLYQYSWHRPHASYQSPITRIPI